MVDVVVRKGNEGLLRNFPGLRRIIVWDKSGRKFTNLLFLLPEIRKEKYDQVINLQRFASSGFLTVFSKGKEKTGFDKNPFSGFFTRSVPHEIKKEKGIHEVERNLLLIKHLTTDVIHRPVLFPSPEDIALIEKFTDRPYVCIAPASVWYTKQLPAERWILLIRSILQRSSPDCRIYLTGGASDISYCEVIQQAVSDSRVVILAGSLSILQTAALMKGAVRNYVNDSAPLHLASAMNAPVTAFFCSTVPWFGFGPLSDDSIIAQTPEVLDCKPCGLHGYRECPMGHFRCATTIPVSEFAVTL